MSLTNIPVPREYGYVVLAGTASLLVNSWHALRVGPFRKAAGVPYPHQYATPEQISAAAAADDDKRKTALYLFNCAQRAHYNYMESHPSFLVALFVAGLRAPVAASVLGALWCVGRIMYAVGYTDPTKQNGRGRLIGSWSAANLLALFGMAAWTGYKMLTE